MIVYTFSTCLKCQKHSQGNRFYSARSRLKNEPFLEDVKKCSRVQGVKKFNNLTILTFKTYEKTCQDVCGKSNAKTAFAVQQLEKRFIFSSQKQPSRAAFFHF